MTGKMNPIKDKLKYYILQSLDIIDTNILRRLSGINPLLPFYHTVSNERLPHLVYLYQFKNVDQFILDLDYFLCYYKSISLEKLIKHKKEGIKIPSNSIHITFDDGLKENYQIIAPILKEKNLDATFFISTSFINNQKLFYRHKASVIINYLQESNNKKYEKLTMEVLKDNNINFQDLIQGILSVSYEKQDTLDVISNEIDFSFQEYLNFYQPYLKSNQISSLISEGFSIGSHSCDHPYYQKINLSEQIKQTHTSLNLLSDQFSIKYKAFAIPYNDLDLNSDFFNALYSNLGIDIYFGTAGMLIDQYKSNYQRFHLEGKYSGISPYKVVKNKYSNVIFERLRGRSILMRQ